MIINKVDVAEAARSTLLHGAKPRNSHSSRSISWRSSNDMLWIHKCDCVATHMQRAGVLELPCKNVERETFKDVLSATQISWRDAWPRTHQKCSRPHACALLNRNVLAQCWDGTCASVRDEMFPAHAYILNAPLKCASSKMSLKQGEHEERALCTGTVRQMCAMAECPLTTALRVPL